MSILTDEEIQSYDIPRNYFNRNEKWISNMEVGKIYPIQTSIMWPGDKISYGNQVVIRQQPTLSPSYSNFKFTTRAFFVAFRNLDRKFPWWMKGYKDYNIEKKYEEPITKWIPKTAGEVKPGTLWDAIGMPVNCIPDEQNCPVDYIRQAYGYIWNEYFRYEPIQSSILDDEENPGSWSGTDLLRVTYDRDYFTTCLPYQQLSDPIALPIVGQTSAVYKDADFGAVFKSELPPTTVIGKSTIDRLNPIGILTRDNEAGAVTRFTELLNKNTVSLDSISSVSISLMRQAFQLQLFAEMNARGGIRTNEFLLMHFGTAPSDETLGRPIYLGSTRTNIVTQELLQTSASTDTQPLGQMSGHGVGVSEVNGIEYRAKEPGVFMVLAYIKPETIYGSQGINRELCFNTKYDIPFPVLQHLSEQSVRKAEILCVSTKKISENYEILGDQKEEAEKYNNDIFGYRPIYDYLRRGTDRVHGLFIQEQLYNQEGSKVVKKNNLYNWTEARFFSINNGERPALNDDFLNVKIDNRNFTVVNNEVIERSQFLVWINNLNGWWRPLTKLGTPGRIDHVI